MKKIIILVMGVLIMASAVAAPKCAETIAISMIAKEEAFHPTWYRCSAKVKTIGYGFTSGILTAEQMKMTTIDRKTADAILGQWVRKILVQVNTETKGCNLTEMQKAVLVSMAWNIGFPSLKSSTLMKRIKAGASVDSIQEAIKMWNKATNPKTGKLEVSAGLVNRRARDAANWAS